LKAMDGDMNRFTSILCCAAVVHLTAAPTALAGNTSANDPVELAPDPADQASNTADVVDERAIESDDETNRAESDAQDSQPATPLESRLLGEPNGLLSARPADIKNEAANESILERVDPRRNEFLRVVGALGVVLALLFIIRKMIGRAPGWLGASARPSGVMEVLARYPMGKGQSLVLLRLARRVLLLHQANGSMTTLSEMSEPQEVAQLLARLESGARDRDALRFRSTLRTFEAEYEKLGEREAGDGNRVQVVDLTKRRRPGVAKLLGRGEDVG